ncbi:hypothetical protein M5689_007782 [Euphorbia peplus]|nr:hypothetical protein M5689_007782 [Euphorbia peplus]
MPTNRMLGNAVSGSVLSRISVSTATHPTSRSNPLYLSSPKPRSNRVEASTNYRSVVQSQDRHGVYVYVEYEDLVASDSRGNASLIEATVTSIIDLLYF